MRHPVPVFPSEILWRGESPDALGEIRDLPESRAHGLSHRSSSDRELRYGPQTERFQEEGSARPYRTPPSRHPCSENPKAIEPPDHTEKDRLGSPRDGEATGPWRGHRRPDTRGY